MCSLELGPDPAGPNPKTSSECIRVLRTSFAEGSLQVLQGDLCT